MKIHMTIAASASLALAACGGGDKSAEKPAEKTAEAPKTEATTPTAATPAKGTKPDKAFVVGKWGTNGDCSLALDLRADGTSDGPFGNWNYNDGVITFADAPEMKVTVVVVDDKTMESLPDNPGSTGKKQMMTRCP